MTQADLDRIKELDDQIAQVDRLFTSALMMLQQERQSLFKSCDHRTPDGITAMEDSMFCSVCNICHYSDL